MVTNVDIFEEVRTRADSQGIPYKYEERSGTKYLTFGLLDIDFNEDGSMELRVYAVSDPDVLLLSIYAWGDGDTVSTAKIRNIINQLFDNELFEYTAKSGVPILVKKTEDDQIEPIQSSDRTYLRAKAQANIVPLLMSKSQ